jgi:hypothetical protein
MAVNYQGKKLYIIGPREVLLKGRLSTVDLLMK